MANIQYLSNGGAGTLRAVETLQDMRSGLVIRRWDLVIPALMRGADEGA
jgi:hypothetical protein